MGLSRVAGALVTRVYDKGPAAEAGLEVGDVIIGIDGIDVADARGVYYRLTVHGIGNRSRLDVLRKGRQVAVNVALRPAPETSRDDVRNLSGQHPFDGARVANLVPSIADELNIEDQDGVVIVSVRNASTAANIGFRLGDLIVQVGNEKVENVGQLERAVRDRRRVWQVAVKRGDQLLQLQIGG